MINHLTRTSDHRKASLHIHSTRILHNFWKIIAYYKKKNLIIGYIIISVITQTTGSLSREAEELNLLLKVTQAEESE